MNAINPEAIGLFGLFATVICFGLEQIGVGVKNADTTKLTRTLGLIAIIMGGAPQLFASTFMYLFQTGGMYSKYLGTIFGFFGAFWTLAGIFFIVGGDKKVMAHFFATGLFLTVLFTLKAFRAGLIWPLGIDLVVIDLLLFLLIISWYTGNKSVTVLAGICNLAIGFISAFLLVPQVLN